MLHPEVSATIEINIARSADEAERQARGENVLARVEEKPEDDAETAEFFDAGAGEAAKAE
jgi:large subunit ribosomal protein L9